MEYFLMHKRIPVLKLELDSASGAIVSIGEIYEPEHIPVGVSIKNGGIDRGALNAWWRGRSIPDSRSGLRDALTALGVIDQLLLVEKCLGLSLSDQYWICPQDTDLKWDEVNFFDNDFSDDVGNILLGRASKGREEALSLMSPDNTSDGWLKKKWSIINGKRCLVKGGSGVLQQEPYNEVLASAIMRRLNIPHVHYSILMQDDYPYSVCEDFVTADTELIPAWYILQTQKKENHVSIYQHFIDCCEGIGLKGTKDFLNQLICLDYLIANEDRHQNNFGVIRNANTLEYIGFAPIYDNGTSMFLSTPTNKINGLANSIPAKPFKKTHAEQIKLVTSFEWINFEKMKGIGNEFYEILSKSDFMDETRKQVLCGALDERVAQLEISNKQEGMK